MDTSALSSYDPLANPFPGYNEPEMTGVTLILNSLDNHHGCDL